VQSIHVCATRLALARTAAMAAVFLKRTRKYRYKMQSWA